MKKTVAARILALAICAGIAMAGVSLGSSAAGEAQPLPDAKAAREFLERAMEQARKGGQGTVSIDLDRAMPDPSKAQTGDLVRIHYTVTLEDGSLVRTTSEAAAQDGRKRVPGFEEPKSLGPEELLIGEDGFLPGMKEVLEGMAMGEKRTSTLPPEKAFGPADPKKTMQLPCAKRMPLVIDMSPEEYVGRFKSFPVVGTEVNVVPYFRARVQAVAERAARLEFLPRDGERVQESFGTAWIRSDGNDVTITLEPTIGALFEVQGRQGRIVSTDGTTFTVDFNHPAAGKPVALDVEVVSLEKASRFAGREIPWFDEHDLGMELARASERHMVLVLYASWCSWSKKLLNEAMADPRIKALEDDFVWVKIDADQHKEWGRRYGQNGFPLTVLVGPDGNVLKKIDGFRDAKALRQELQGVLNGSGRRASSARREE